MADTVKPETFVSTATIYKSGAGHPFAPGSAVDLHPDHAKDLREAGLEYLPPKVDQAAKGDSKKS